MLATPVMVTACHHLRSSVYVCILFEGNMPTTVHGPTSDTALVVLLQQSMSDETRPPLPAFLIALKEGFTAYEAARSVLLDEDEEAGRAADPNAARHDCPDKHEKCPFWAHIVCTCIVVCAVCL